MVGCVTGEFGDGQGEADKTELAMDTCTYVLDTELQYAAEQDHQNESSGDIRQSCSLLILYVRLRDNWAFSSLVWTSRNIRAAGLL